MKYYEIYVFLSRKDGYSTWFKTDEVLKSEDDIITYAVDNNHLLNCDSGDVLYANEIDEETYKEVMGDE